MEELGKRQEEKRARINPGNRTRLIWDCNSTGLNLELRFEQVQRCHEARRQMQSLSTVAKDYMTQSGLGSNSGENRCSSVESVWAKTHSIIIKQ